MAFLTIKKRGEGADSVIDGWTRVDSLNVQGSTPVLPQAMDFFIEI